MNKRIIALLLSLASSIAYTAAFNLPGAEPNQQIYLALNNETNDALIFDSNVTIPSNQIEIVIVEIGKKIQDLLAQFKSNDRTFEVLPPATLNDTIQYEAFVTFKNDLNPEVVHVSIRRQQSMMQPNAALAVDDSDEFSESGEESDDDEESDDEEDDFSYEIIESSDENDEPQYDEPDITFEAAGAA